VHGAKLAFPAIGVKNYLANGYKEGLKGKQAESRGFFTTQKMKSKLPSCHFTFHFCLFLPFKFF